jgi:hypothetical protein
VVWKTGSWSAGDNCSRSVSATGMRYVMKNVKFDASQISMCIVFANYIQEITPPNHIK